jgi:hypothetical protein
MRRSSSASSWRAIVQAADAPVDAFERDAAPQYARASSGRQSNVPEQ